MNFNIDSVWENVLEEIKLSVSAAVFQTLFSQTAIAEVNNNNVEVSCPSPYIADLIQKRYLPLLASSLEHQLKSKPIKINIRVTTPKISSSPKTGPLFDRPAPSAPDQKGRASTGSNNHYDPRTGLHPRFTFATFVVGNSNNFAYAASQAIVKNPGLAYNPYFVWGGVGVGKTHLVQGIGHAISQANQNQKIIYATAETFTNELVSALRAKTMAQFKQKYRQPDVLIIDDIQFIAGKEYIQEEFFHTFNSLYIAEKQIILTSDRKPEEIRQVEDRLISRFMGGLTVDIQSPDYEMRVAILKQKAEEKNIIIPEDAVAFIAETIQSNTRELEGVLSQIMARASAENLEISLPLVKNYFGIKKTLRPKRTSYRKIISVVAKEFKIKSCDICGKVRKKNIAMARHVAAYLLRKELGIPLQQIGIILGGKDHTTIMHAQEKIDRAFSTNQQLRHRIIEIQKKI